MNIDDLDFEKDKSNQSDIVDTPDKKVIKSFYLSFPFIYFIASGTLSSLILLILGVIKLIELLKI